MGKENKIRTLDVYCKEGHLLFERYRKVGAGRLIKTFRDEIGEDHTNSGGLPTHGVIFCNHCVPPRPVAVVEIIHGRVAFKINQAGVRRTIT